MRVPSMPVNNKAMLQKLPLKVYRRLEEVVAGCPYLEWHHFDAGVIKVRQQGGQKRPLLTVPALVLQKYVGLCTLHATALLHDGMAAICLRAGCFCHAAQLAYTCAQHTCCFLRPTVDALLPVAVAACSLQVLGQLSKMAEDDVFTELDLLAHADLSNVEYMPAYLNKRLNNKLWSRRKLEG